MAVRFKGAHAPPAIMLMGVRWDGAYPVRERPVAERMEERGGPIDHATIQRWVVKYRPHLAAAFSRRKRPLGRSWRRDETDIRVKGAWRSLSRAVDKSGQTVALLLPEQREEQAATRFLTQARRRHGVPEKSPIDGSEANAAAIRSSKAGHGTAMIIRQMKYLKHTSAHDHRRVKRVTRPMLGFNALAAAKVRWPASSSCIG